MTIYALTIGASSMQSTDHETRKRTMTPIQRATDTPITTDEKPTNPFANPKAKAGILQRETQLRQESLRRNAQKIIDDADVPMLKGIEFMASLGPIDEAALDVVKGHEYLDKLAKLCREECLRSIPPAPPKQPKQPIDESKPHFVGTGPSRHIDTGEIIMPKPKEPMQSQLIDSASAGVTSKTVLGNPITDEPIIIDTPAKIAEQLEAIKAAAKTPDLSDVTRLKEASKAAFETDPLTGKADDAIIPAEVISESSALDATFGPNPEAPLFDFDAAITVANLLGKAFPDAAADYKLHFFRETTGLNLVKDATTAQMQIEMFAKLNAAIENAKTNPVETQDQPETSVENATEKVSNSGHSEVATHTDSDKPLSSQTLPENTSNSTALVVVPKTEVIAPPKSVGFKMPSKDEFSYMQQLAKSVAASHFYKDIDTPDKALVIMMKGYALQVDPMTALDGIYIILGRPYVGAKLMKALLENTGQCQRFDIFGDDHQCTVTIQRKGRTPNSYKFSWQDAETAKLTSKDNWKNSPKKMLKWRAIKEAVETEFAELAFGLGMGGVDEDEEAA